MATSRTVKSTVKPSSTVTKAKPARKRTASKRRPGSELKELSHAELGPMGLYPGEGAPEGDPYADYRDLDEEETEPGPPAPSAEELQAREALKAVLLPLLRESLRIEVESGHFTSPNDRTVKVFFDNECLAQATFDIRSRGEYEG